MTEDILTKRDCLADVLDLLHAQGKQFQKEPCSVPTDKGKEETEAAKQRYPIVSSPNRLDTWDVSSNEYRCEPH